MQNKKQKPVSFRQMWEGGNLFILCVLKFVKVYSSSSVRLSLHILHEYIMWSIISPAVPWASASCHSKYTQSERWLTVPLLCLRLPPHTHRLICRGIPCGRSLYWPPSYSTSALTHPCLVFSATHQYRGQDSPGTHCIHWHLLRPTFEAFFQAWMLSNVWTAV